MRQMMHSCGTYQFDYRVIGLDGSVRTMEARGRVVPGPDRPASQDDRLCHGHHDHLGQP